MKNYVNGKPIQSGETQKAKEILLSKGIYHTLGNWGAYTPNKLSRLRIKETEVFVKDGFEFRIIESEVMSFSLSSLEVSKPYIQKECWYQPI
jgi:hypothetical protein